LPFKTAQLSRITMASSLPTDIVATDLWNADTRLVKLLEDFVHAKQIHLSLKQQIEHILSEKDQEFKDQEEEAKVLWMNSHARTRGFQRSVKLLKQRMEQVEEG
jgi:hypothetical protein